MHSRLLINAVSLQFNNYSQIRDRTSFKSKWAKNESFTIILPSSEILDVFADRLYCGWIS
jgi:hypothetical protein